MRAILLVLAIPGCGRSTPAPPVPAELDEVCSPTLHGKRVVVAGMLVYEGSIGCAGACSFNLASTPSGTGLPAIFPVGPGTNQVERVGHDPSGRILAEHLRFRDLRGTVVDFGQPIRVTGELELHQSGSATRKPSPPRCSLTVDNFEKI